MTTKKVAGLYVDDGRVRQALESRVDKEGVVEIVMDWVHEGRESRKQVGSLKAQITKYKKEVGELLKALAEEKEEVKSQDALVEAKQEKIDSLRTYIEEHARMHKTANKQEFDTKGKELEAKWEGAISERDSIIASQESLIQDLKKQVTYRVNERNEEARLKCALQKENKRLLQRLDTLDNKLTDATVGREVLGELLDRHEEAFKKIKETVKWAGNYYCEKSKEEQDRIFAETKETKPEGEKPSTPPCPHCGLPVGECKRNHGGSYAKKPTIYHLVEEGDSLLGAEKFACGIKPAEGDPMETVGYLETWKVTCEDCKATDFFKEEASKEQEGSAPSTPTDGPTIMEVLPNRVKVARHDTLYLDCPWCGSKVDLGQSSEGVTICDDCGTHIQVKETS